MSFYRLFGSFFRRLFKGHGNETETLSETKRDTKLGRKLYHEKKLTLCRVENLVNQDGKRRRGDVWS